MHQAVRVCDIGSKGSVTALNTGGHSGTRGDAPYWGITRAVRFKHCFPVSCSASFFRAPDHHSKYGVSLVIESVGSVASSIRCGALQSVQILLKSNAFAYLSSYELGPDAREQEESHELRVGAVIEILPADCRPQQGTALVCRRKHFARDVGS